MEALLQKLLKGDKDATALCITFFNWCNDYDHLIDDDTSDVDQKATIHRAMDAVVSMMGNPFFAANQAALYNTIVNCVSAWKISTKLQRGGDPKGHEVAHVLRWTPIEFFMHCARILHGESWVQGAGARFWLEMTEAHSFQQFQLECGADAPGSGRNYDDETREYLRFGIRVMQAAMLADTEAVHCARLLDLVRPKSAAVYVDMGCGVGEVGRHIMTLDPVAAYVGVTNSQFQKMMLDQAGLSSVVSDMSSTGLPSASADVVMFNESFGYGAPDKLLAEAHRLLRAGGVLFIKDQAPTADTFVADWGYHLKTVDSMRALITARGFTGTDVSQPTADYARYDNFMANSALMRGTHTYGALKTLAVYRAVKGT